MFLVDPEDITVLARLKADNDVPDERGIDKETRVQSAYVGVEPKQMLELEWVVVAPGNADVVLVLQADGISRWAMRLEKSSHSSQFYKVHQGVIDHVWKKLRINGRKRYFTAIMVTEQVGPEMVWKKEQASEPRDAHGCINLIVHVIAKDAVTKPFGGMRFGNDGRQENNLKQLGDATKPPPDMYIGFGPGQVPSQRKKGMVDHLLNERYPARAYHTMSWLVRRTSQLGNMSRKTPSIELPMDVQQRVEQGEAQRANLFKGISMGRSGPALVGQGNARPAVGSSSAQSPKFVNTAKFSSQQIDSFAKDIEKKEALLAAEDVVIGEKRKRIDEEAEELSARDVACNKERKEHEKSVQALEMKKSELAYLRHYAANSSN